GDGADALLADAVALEEAGALAVVLELVPAPLATRVSETLEVPTIGIGAGAGCDGQVLVWQDMAGLSGFEPRFVKAFADLRSELSRAAREYADAVRAKSFPAPEHTFEQ
ncbi:MAG: 3-methyl-2-oxobutanoate hydroxymethyltransferase, partial [Dermabacter sp.]|nr:3-methyl-2-oxobutanoate hydroxymethyltransferase [Dermabacter sp.]